MDARTKDERTAAIRAQIFHTLAELNGLCHKLLAGQDPISVYNDLHKLKSLVGQVQSDALRYKDLA